MKHLITLAAVIALAACNSESDSDGLVNGIVPKLVVSAVSPDYGTSDVIIVGDAFLNNDIVVEGLLTTTNITDLSVEVYDGDIYRIGKFGTDNITRFSWDVANSDISTDWQYSVLGDESSANPYAIAFASESKAYVARYASNELWIIDPSAANEEDFFVQSLDLSPYATSSDGIANAADVKIVDDQLFVLLQDLDGFNPVVDSSIAVFDITTDTIIDVDSSASGDQTINLGVRNAFALTLADDGLLYVDARGDAYGNTGEPAAKYTGGIVTVDPDSYETELVVDDGNETDAPYGTITNVAVADNGDIYFSGSASYGDDKLYVLDLGETAAIEISLGTNNYNISALAERDGQIYVGVQAQFDGSESAGLKVISVTSQAVTDFIETTFNPNAIAAVE